MSGNQLVSFTKVTKFDGEEENFSLWNIKFEVIATLKGFHKSLQPNFKNEMSDKFDDVLRDNNANEKRRRTCLRRTILQ